MIRHIVFLILLSFSVVFPFNIPDQPKGRVNDYSYTLSPSFIDRLEKKLEDFELRTQNQIVIVMIDSLDGEDIEGFSMKLAEKWKIGKKNLDNGVIITIAMAERKIRIEVGYGLEERLTDALSSDIIRNIIAPAFREKNYEKGIENAVERIMAIISQEGDNSDDMRKIIFEQNSFLKYKMFFKFIALIFALIGIFFVIDILRYNFGNDKKYYNFLEWFLIFSITLLILKIIFYALMSAGRGYTGGSGGFRSGGGGFSGGGGRFGGGGASGGW